MHDLDIGVVFDLGGKTARRSEGLRAALLERLQNPKTSMYEFSLPNFWGITGGGLRFRPQIGAKVEVNFRSHDCNGEHWRLLAGLATCYATLKETGTDHFPLAGFYDSRSLALWRIRGAYAKVSWDVGHDMALDEEQLAKIVKDVASNSYTGTTSVDLPMVCSRSWRLAMSAPTLGKLLRGYRHLREGAWQPRLFFDGLLDEHKVRLLTQRTEQDNW